MRYGPMVRPPWTLTPPSGARVSARTGSAPASAGRDDPRGARRHAGGLGAATRRLDVSVCRGARRSPASRPAARRGSPTRRRVRGRVPDSSAEPAGAFACGASNAVGTCARRSGSGAAHGSGPARIAPFPAAQSVQGLPHVWVRRNRPLAPPIPRPTYLRPASSNTISSLPSNQMFLRCGSVKKNPR